ncbi:MAG: hypothetical protein H7177_13305 [Rhizobacter sp.]|nr:hypothetical protein [Bacteriovorax sp.]
MKLSTTIISIFALMIFSGCSKQAGKTDAKLKLNLAGIVDFSSGIGSAGAILFGKSATGEQFGKIITSTEENLELTNGDWSFYAVMWKNVGADKFSDRAYCGKSVQKLTGVAASVSMSLNNVNCADNDFSGGLSYDKFVSPDTLKHFADFYIEDCEDANAANNYTCRKSNHGSAISYRLAFKSYKRMPGGPVQLSTETLYSVCTTNTAMASIGMQSNFPSSNTAMPFVVSVEMFLSTANCDPADPKGIYTYTFDQGLSSNTPLNKLVSNGGYSCTPTITTEQQCVDIGGTWSGSCTGIPTPISKFIPVAECTAAPSAPTSSTVRNLKQMVTMPTAFICRNNSTTATGTDVFPAGDGSANRPFAICNEWQINQIGEASSSAAMATYNYKLLNNLDMNKTDFSGNYPKPSCMGVAGSLITDHHNFNPLDKIIDGACNNVWGTPGFTGHFDGNNKVISNARIVSETSLYLGFVRKLNSNGWIRNLSFKNLEVRGLNFIGGVAGESSTSAADAIKNIKIDKLELEAKNNGNTDGEFVGGITGVFSLSTITDAIVTNAKLRGRNKVGGLVGENSGTIKKAKFRGVIRNDSGNSSNYIGGLTGHNASSGVIDSSFSEGAINSSADNTGGIAGVNEGIIKNFYSLMTVSVDYFGAPSTASIGGITGTDIGGTVTNGYFDGLVAYTGNSALSNHKFTSLVSNSYNSCFNDLSNTQVCGNLTYATIRMASSYTIYAADAPLWQFEASDTMTPKLAWENRECFTNSNSSTVAAQISSGRGTAANPVNICTSSQFKDMGSGTAYFYKMLDDINIANFTKASFIPSFNGVFDGTDHSLYGLFVTMSTDSSEKVGLINENNGTIKNLFLIGDTITNSDASDLATGLLTGSNLGTIANVKVRGSAVSGRFVVGIIAGDNGNGAFGTIEKVDVDNVTVQGESKVGGIAGRNFTNGKILRAMAKANIGKFAPAASTVNSFGGIAGYNNGTIDQARVDGSITLVAPTASATVEVGGIVGNNLGIIKNTMTVDRFRINVADTKNVGGLAGKNTGTINTSFAVGKTIFSYLNSIATAAENFHSLVGLNTGSMLNSYYLENSAASMVVNSRQTTACAYNGPGDYRFATDATANFTMASGSKPDAILLQSNGNSMSVLTPVVIPVDYTLSIGITCPNTGTNYESFVLYDLTPNYTTGVQNAGAFFNPATFIYGGSAWDMGYLNHTNPALSIRESDIMDYFKADMYGNVVPSNVPVWMIEEGEKYPSLVQLDHN